MLGAAEHAPVRPGERLAVDVLLQQALAHHQRERTLGAAPGRIGALVNDVAEIVQAARIRWLAGGEPGFARLPAFPGLGRKAEDLDLDAAAFQCARQDFRATRRDHDRPTAHGAGVVDQQRDDGVLEVRIALALETQRRHGVHDHARQPRRIEHTLFEVEIPGAVLLREQLALQLVGQTRDGRREVLQFLVEERAQALQFVRRRQILGVDLLVAGLLEHLVAEQFGVLEHGLVRPPAFRALGHVVGIRIVEVDVGLALLLGLGRLALFTFSALLVDLLVLRLGALLLLLGFGVATFGLLLFAVVAVGLLAIGLAFDQL